MFKSCIGCRRRPPSPPPPLIRKKKTDQWFNFILDLSDPTQLRTGPNEVSERSTKFHEMVKNKDCEGIRVLIATGWRVNERMYTDERGIPNTTALIEMICKNWAEGAKIILQSGADPQFRIWPSYTPLEYCMQKALEEDMKDIVKVMLDHGAVPDHKSRKNGITPLMMSVRCCIWDGDNTVFKLMLKAGADHNNMGNSAFSGILNHMKNSVEQALWKAHDNPDIDSDDDESQEYIDKRMKKARTASIEMIQIFRDFGHEKVTFSLLPLISPFHFNKDLEVFLPEHLDLIYKEGIDIHTFEPGSVDSAFDYCIKKYSHANNVRWLIRHGAKTSHVTLGHLLRFFEPRSCNVFYDVPMILLKSGMRVPNGLRFLLEDLSNMMRDYLRLAMESPYSPAMYYYIEAMKKELTAGMEPLKIPGEFYEHDGEEGEITFTTPREDVHSTFMVNQRDIFRIPRKPVEGEAWVAEEEKQVSPISEYLSKYDRSKQMADLESFSGRDLHYYPPVYRKGYFLKQYPVIQWQLARCVGFMRRPQKLQWYCRQVIRESMICLDPCIMKDLELPFLLKQYLLCHDV